MIPTIEYQYYSISYLWGGFGARSIIGSHYIVCYLLVAL